MDQFFQDLRIGMRMLFKAPGFFIVAVVTLALGIGANTAIFSVVDGALLAALPYRQPSRLARVYQSTRVFHHESLSYLNLLDWQRMNNVFSGMAATRFSAFNFTGDGAAELLNSGDITANYFQVLGLPLTLGRGFNANEDIPGGRPAVILSYGLWQRRFGSSPKVLGRSMELNGKDYTIVGVAPRHFRLFGKQDIFVPMGQGSPAMLQNREISPGIQAVARLKPGVSLAAARADMKSVAAQLARAYPVADGHVSAAMESLTHWVESGSSATIWMLLGAVGLVLLIACANVANLMLARAMKRNREFAVRSALGASPVRLARQLLTESILLALIGGGLGAWLAWMILPALLKLAPGGWNGMAMMSRVHLNWTVLGFTLGISILTGILFGLAPLWHGLKLQLQQELKEGGRGGSAARGRASSALIVAEVALTLVLMTGAGLLLRSLHALYNLHPGFAVRHVLTFNVALPPGASQSPDLILKDFHTTIRGIEHTPGITAAGLTSLVPLAGNDSELGYWTRPGPPPPPSATKPTLLYVVTPGYRPAMKIPLLRGRFIGRQDRAGVPFVVVIDQALAQKAFPGQNPVGKTLYAQFIGPMRIVGEVGHVSHWGLAADATSKIRPEIYVAFDQIPPQFLPAFLSGMTVMARTRGPALQAVPEVRAAIRKISTNEPIYQVETMRKIVRDSESDRRFPMQLLEIFSGLAVLLAAVGIYGVISYGVAQRTRELGVRQALGADRGAVMKLVLTGSLRLALWGIGIGIAAAIPAALLLKHLLYGVTVYDPVTLLAAALLFLGVAYAASYLPARAAAAVDPLEALRVE